MSPLVRALLAKSWAKDGSGGERDLGLQGKLRQVAIDERGEGEIGFAQRENKALATRDKKE